MNASRVLAFDSTGHGKDSVVVLLHGWPLNRSIWSGVAARIAASGSRVLAPDLPGFGESPSIELDRATIEAYADEVARFIGAFKARRVAVAGHSFGGYVALALADHHPDLVAGLGLISSRTTADTETARRERHDTIEKVRAGGTKVLLPGLAEKLVGPRAVEWRKQATRLIERARPDGVMAALAAMAGRPDRTAVFDSFAGPRLVVHGTDDGLIPVSEAPQTGRGPPDVRVIVDGVGHMPMWEAPDATAEAVIAWTKSLRA
jgi:pimeloyl-ACP methyl ester carboxylesterase